MTNISQRVKKTRQALGLNQTEFADRMRFTRHYVSLLERGKSKNPSVRFIEQLAFLEAEAEKIISPSRDAKYSSLAEEAPDYRIVNPPQHPPEFHHGRDAPPPCATPTENYSEAVKILGELLEKKPDELAALMFTLRAIRKSIEG